MAKGRRAEPRVYLSPYTAPAGAGDRFLGELSARGFLPSSFMSVLLAPAGDADLPAPAGLEVREVGGADRDAFLDIWLAPVEEAERSPFRSLARHEFADWRAFIALLDGEPAGVASLFIGERVGVLAGAVTLPSFRGRGVQTALLRRRIAEAAGAGCALVAAQASPGTISERNMQRVGLRPAFGQVLFVQRTAVAAGGGETNGG